MPRLDFEKGKLYYSSAMNNPAEIRPFIPSNETGENRVTEATGVLFIEDDPDIVMLIEMMTEGHSGVKTHIVSSMEEARVVMKAIDIGVAYVDWSIGGLNSCAELKAICPDIRTVAFTADDRVRELVGSESVDDYLEKPFDYDVLEQSIDKNAALWKEAKVSSGEKMQRTIVDFGRTS